LTLDESTETREKTRLAVARAKEGDAEALRFLYASYSDNIYGYVRFARNVAIDHLRANRLTPTETVFDPDAAWSADLDRAVTVREALAALPEEQREVVILRHVAGLTPGEIADRMGRTEGSIHGLHHRVPRCARGLASHGQPARTPKSEAASASGSARDCRYPLRR